MPGTSQEQLRQKTAELKKKLADKGASMDASTVRGLKKRIRRHQRRRRALEARAKRLAGKADAKAEG